MYKYQNKLLSIITISTTFKNVLDNTHFRKNINLHYFMQVCKLIDKFSNNLVDIHA